MPNIELLEKSMPVAPIRIAALGCRELAEEVDRKLVKFRKELVERKQLSVIPQGYSEESFIVECECPRFGTGEGKGYIKESVRGTDLYIMVDVTNYSESYTVCGHENHMSPDNHFQDLKRIISAATGKAHRINVIMPFLYEGRQHNIIKFLICHNHDASRCGSGRKHSRETHSGIVSQVLSNSCSADAFQVYRRCF